MKTALTVILVCLMIMSSLCGCDFGNNGALLPTATTASTTVETTAQTAEAPDRVLIFCNLPIPEVDALFESSGRTRSDIPDEKYEQLLDKLRDRYDIDYNVYSKGEFIGTRSGKVRGDWQLEYFFDIDLGIDYNGRYEDIYMAIDTNHTFLPAKLNYDATKTVSEDILTEIKAKYNLAELKVEEKIDVDLDGDGKSESIVTVSHPEEYFSANVLLDHNDKIVSYMQVCIIEKYFQSSDPYNNFYLTQFMGEIADTDNDGIMEIYMIYASHNGFIYDMFTYDKGVFSGNFVNMSQINP